MGQVYVDENSLSSIGNAIRNITGTANNFYPNQMGPTIENISMGPEITDASYLFERGGGARGHNKIQFESIIDCLSPKLNNTSHMFTNVSTSDRSINSGNFPLFDTSNVIDMTSMFYGYRLGINIPNYNTSKVTNMAYMFYSCDNLKVEQVENFDTSNVTNMERIFSSHYFNYFNNIPNWDYSKVYTIAGMFEGCQGRAVSTPRPEAFDGSSFNIPNVYVIDNMFNRCGFFTNEICNLDFSKISSSASGLFRGTTTNYIHDINLCNLFSSQFLFENCNTIGIYNINLSNFTNASGVSAGGPFGSAKAEFFENIDLSKSNSAYYLFVGCNKTKTMSNINLINIANAVNAFSYCTNLMQIDNIVFPSSSIQCYGMFAGCNNLVSIFNTTIHVDNAQFMFSGCNNLITLPNFITTNFANAYCMFSSCFNLIGMPQYNTSNVINMSQMFLRCNNLSNESIQNIVNMCINSNVNSSYRNLSCNNYYSPLYGTMFNNSYYQDRWQELTDAGWTY